MTNLVVIPSRYPCALHPTWHVFVREIAHAFARQGLNVSVVAPLPVHRAWRGGDAYRSEEDAGDGARVTVYRPRYLAWSSKTIGPWNTFALTLAFFWRAALRCAQRLPTTPDAIYSHFLYPAGAAAVRVGTHLGIPAFLGVGEISLDTMNELGIARAQRELASARGYLANSTHLARLLQERLGVPASRIGVFPNGIDPRRFRPLDRQAMRAKHGLPPDRMLVGFVGGFEERKGPRRVAEAMGTGCGVSGVFIGVGNEPPSGENVAFCRRLPHDQVPELLSACDVFALPTTDEGCCNAVLEAMACGLPVISSNGAFNDDILSPEMSIRVDPMDVPAIRAAILRLRDDLGLRQGMSRAALAWSKQFNIDQRAQRMLAFMDRMRV